MMTRHWDRLWYDIWLATWTADNNRSLFWVHVYRAATDRKFRWPAKPDGQCGLPRCEKPLPKGRRHWCSYEHMRIGYSCCNFRDAVLWFYGKVCALCGSTDGPFEADHIVPVIEGGPSTLENGRVLCERCHKEQTKSLAARRAKRRTRQEELAI
jgi:5-methylcytosine-specific restriction endonuclease McrA